MTRRLLLLGLLLLALVAFPGGALAGGDSSAVAVNDKDGSSLFRFVFDVKRDADAVVDEQNAAVAVAQCNDCETVAIAIQLVLVTGNPDTVTPTNVALAYNQDCNLCQTMALAYQVVVGTGGPVHFTHDGNKELEQIRKALHDLEKSDLPLDQLKAQVDALVVRLKQVVATQLVHDDGQEGDGGDAGEPPGTATTGTDTTPTTQAATTEPAATTVATSTETATEPATTDAATTNTTTP